MNAVYLRLFLPLRPVAHNLPLVLMSMILAVAGPAQTYQPRDANGWTVLATSPDSRVVYVSSSTGNDANNGLSPATAKATIAAGDALIRNGFPDHLLLKRGDTFSTSGLGRWKSGRSATEPIVLSSYGDGDDRPVIKLTGVFIDHNGQARNYQVFTQLDFYKANSDPASPEFNGSSSIVGLRFVGGGASLLVEDCRLRFIEIVVQSLSGTYSSFQFRRNIVTDTWVSNSFTNGNARIQGMYVQETGPGFLLEENVFDHNGWSETVPGAGANQFNHNVYINYDNAAGAVIRGNVFARGAAHGLQARSGGVVERNLFVQNAVSVNVGGVQAPTDPNVASFPNRATQNMIIEGRLMDPAGNNGSPRTTAVWGIWTAFINGVLVDDNVIANRAGNGSNSAFNQQTPMTLVDNIVYQWDPAYNTSDPSWPHPAAKLADYYASLGGTASTPLYLEWLRNRPVGQLPWSMTAYAAINYLRAGFNKSAVSGYYGYDGQGAEDSAPRITTSVMPGARQNGPYEVFLAATGGNGAITWSLVEGSLPAGLSLSAAGAITGTATVLGTSTFTVRASDSDAHTGADDEDTRQFQLTVSDLVPHIDPGLLPPAIAGSNYVRALTSTAGDGTLVWSLDAGALPDGLALSSAGVISGTPLTAGTATFAVRVADSDANTGPTDEDVHRFTLTVNPPGSVTATVSQGFVSIPISPQTGTFTAEFDSAVSVVPITCNAGFAATPATAFSGMAVILGYDTAPLNRFIARDGGTYTATNNLNYTAGEFYHVRFVVDIPAHHYSMYVTPPSGAEQLIASNFAFRTEQSGVSSLAYLTLNVGVPTDGWLSVRNVTITPNIKPTVATSALTGGRVGVPYAQTLAATGGNGALAWTLDSGTLPPGLSLAADGAITGTPVAAGTATFVVRVADSDGFTGPADEDVATLTLTIEPGAGLVSLGELTQPYDGTPRAVSVTTVPGGLPVNVTYDGNPAPPIYPGTYGVEAVIDDPNYAGSASGSLRVTTTVLVRHAPVFSGGVDGSVQMLTGENVTFNGNAWVAADLLAPGTPAIQLNGRPDFGGTLDGPGEVAPAGYLVTLNGNALLGRMVRRVDPIPLAAVAPPPPPTGTASITLNRADDNVADWTAVRNLTLNGNVGPRVVPPGSYGSFTANGSSGFILGVPGGTEPATYDFQALTLNGGSKLLVVGPVIVTLGNGLNTSGSIGDESHPAWLTLRFATDGLTLNSGTLMSGNVVAPAGTVTINGNSGVNGRVACDRLVLNGTGRITDPTQPDLGQP